MLNESRRLVLKDDAVAWRQVEGEVVALDLRSAEYLSFNASGQTLWEGLAEGATVHELAQRVVDRFDVSEERALADAEQFVSRLERRGLLDSTAPP